MHHSRLSLHLLGTASLNKKNGKGRIAQTMGGEDHDKLAGWRVALMTMAGRVTRVRFILSVILVYVLIAINVPKWFLRAIDKIIRAFVWKEREQLNGGACLVAWEKVQLPLDLGGLGILNLELMSWGLQICWLWLKKIDPTSSHGLASMPCTFIRMQWLSSTLLWNLRSRMEENNLFWKDKWLMGCCLEDLAPAVVATV